MKITARDIPPRAVWTLEQAGVHPLLARLYAARGVQSQDELDDGLARLLPPTTLLGAQAAAVLLADAMAANKKLCIVADYDCDGATACAVAVRGLRLLGAQQVSYLVPDRVVDGYGLTPPIAQRVKDSGADVLITVDNGIASLEGVATARALGLQVLVTDHHLPVVATDGEVPLPAADVIVNPNQPGCGFESKAIAGVGVMFYVLLALRAELRARGVFAAGTTQPQALAQHGGASTSSARTEQTAHMEQTAHTEQTAPTEQTARPDQIVPTEGGTRTEGANRTGQPDRTDLPAQTDQPVRSAGPEPRLDALLPLVALGTVADVVKLDANNRRLVAQGLKRVRAGALPPGMASLFAVAGRKPQTATTFDFGFALGPRINAAGRLSDMTLGIECLLSDDPLRADELARTLDGINRERREIEGSMRDQALEIAESLFDEGEEPPPAVCVFDPDFHEGVVGIVASRLKDKLHRPTFVFAASQAPGMGHLLKGSGRSIAGFHLRDALDLVSKRFPGVLQRFGGHAMAAGCTLAEDDLAIFEHAFQSVAQQWLDEATLTRRLETDGPLAPEYRRTDVVDTLQREVWGQGFAPPTFSEEVQVVSQRLVGEKHLALKLKHQGSPVDGIWFGHTEPLPAKVTLAFRLDADEWKGVRRVRFLIEGAQD